MAPGDAIRRYWLRTMALTLALLAVWFALTFGSAYFAERLNEWRFLGFPLGFYLMAQGDLLAYPLIVALYARVMNRLDRRYARLCRGDDEAEVD